MSRSNNLRQLIQSILKQLCDNVYYEQADSGAMYPHIVFDFGKIDNGDLHRHDYLVDIDIWDKADSGQGYDARAIEDLADSVEAMLQANNIPQSAILPTFFAVDRKKVADEDKMIRHRKISAQVQLYERKDGENEKV